MGTRRDGVARTGATFDYEKQAWVVNGRYVRCGHIDPCDCYGRQHVGERAELAECDLCTGKRSPRDELERGHVSGMANGGRCLWAGR